MTGDEPLPSEVVEAAVNVCGRAFYYKPPLRDLMVAQGLPRALWDRYATDGNSKYVIARNIFSDLQNQGSNGRTVLRKIVTELANQVRPHDSVEDRRAGQEALDDLRTLATARRMLRDPETSERDARTRAQARAAKARQDRSGRLRTLRDRVTALHSSHESAQARGYALEKVLADLFALEEMTYRPSYRMAHEQVDGAFEHEGFHYLVEARWRSVPPDFGDLADFKGKVDGKLDSTRGLFLSMIGFDNDVVDYFMNAARGSRNNLILFDGRDIMAVLEDVADLRDALKYKVTMASQQAQWWAPLADRY